METRFGVKGNMCDGVFFTENAIPGAKIIRHLHVEVSRQNADLGEVKQHLAREVRALGATVLMNFRYGQKKHEWWELIFTFKWDTESWHGDGDAVEVQIGGDPSGGRDYYTLTKSDRAKIIAASI